MECLRRIRKSRGLTMKQLGEMTGVTESAIGQYETGKRKPSFDMLLKLAGALECHVSALMVPDEEIKNEPGAPEGDELAEELQILRDNPETRALLKGLRNMSPEQVRRLSAWIESMNDGG